MVFGVFTPFPHPAPPPLKAFLRQLQFLGLAFQVLHDTELQTAWPHLGSSATPHLLTWLLSISRAPRGHFTALESACGVEPSSGHPSGRGGTGLSFHCTLSSLELSSIVLCSCAAAHARDTCGRGLGSSLAFSAGLLLSVFINSMDKYLSVKARARGPCFLPARGWRKEVQGRGRVEGGGGI